MMEKGFKARDGTQQKFIDGNADGFKRQEMGKKRLGATYLLFTYKRADYRWSVNDEREIKNDQ